MAYRQNALYKVRQQSQFTGYLDGRLCTGRARRVRDVADRSCNSPLMACPTTQSYDFIWGVGSTHQVTAAATQTGSNGRVYTFQNWSNQASAIADHHRELKAWSLADTG